MAGKDFTKLSDTFAIDMRRSFMHQGILMAVDTGLLEKIRKDPNNQGDKDLAQSYFVHELTHNLTDDEALPMFIEMIYMLEKGHNDRISEIREMYNEGELPEKHNKGLEEISVWLNFEEPGDMLKGLMQKEVNELKKAFAEKLRELEI